MAGNPLQQYFRQPKIYISLPSKGVYNKPGSIDGEVTSLPVYSMTGMDEIIVKTPDALLTGESIVKVIESCVPALTDAWQLSVLDSNLIFAAIKIATFGDTLGVSHTCQKCSTTNDYELDLNKVIDHFNAAKYDNKIVLGNLVIKLRPLNYKQSTEFNLKHFELQKKLTHASKIEDTEEQQRLVDQLWQDLAQVQKDTFALSIDSVETTDTIVTERGFIQEWLEESDKQVIDAIKTQIEKHRKIWAIPAFPIKCNECGTETEVSVELDQSNFFVNS